MQHLAKGPKVEKMAASRHMQGLAKGLIKSMGIGGGDKKFSAMSAEEQAEFRERLSAEVNNTREMLARRQAEALEREARGEPPPPVSVRSRFIALAKRALRQARVDAEMAETEHQEKPKSELPVRVKSGGILKRAKSSNL